VTDKIGDPLAEAAQSGVLGRRPISSMQPPQPATKVQPLGDQVKQEPQRVKRTLMFSPALAKWLKVQAAQEGREMSEIVADALETYKQLHPQV
jgi:hypothetical protein